MPQTPAAIIIKISYVNLGFAASTLVNSDIRLIHALQTQAAVAVALLGNKGGLIRRPNLDLVLGRIQKRHSSKVIMIAHIKRLTDKNMASALKSSRESLVAGGHGL